MSLVFLLYRVLNCEHIYHPSCIDPWLSKRRNACPVCKRKAWRRTDQANSSKTPESREAGQGEEGEEEEEEEEEEPSDLISDDYSTDDRHVRNILLLVP